MIDNLPILFNQDETYSSDYSENEFRFKIIKLFCLLWTTLLF